MPTRFFSLVSLVALSSLIFLGTTFYFLPNQAQAAALEDVKQSVTESAQNVGITDTRAPETLVGQIINTLLGFLGVLFILLTMYAGFLWMTAKGDPKNITKAKDIMQSSVIGLAIILAAYLLVNFVIFTLLKI